MVQQDLYGVILWIDLILKYDDIKKEEVEYYNDIKEGKEE